MLLEVAVDLDAEAEAMEAGGAAERRRAERLPGTKAGEARLCVISRPTDDRCIQIINLSPGGARFRIDRPPAPGTPVTLALPDHLMRLQGAILWVRGPEAAMTFDPETRADPALGRLLRSDSLAELVRA